MRVLIVEDEVKLAALIRRGLRDEGMLADVAVTGEDALWMAAATAYDAIVLDVMLPGLDGFEVCDRLAAAGARPAVVLTSTRDASSYTDRLAHSSARGFVAKHALSASAVLSLVGSTS